MLWQYKKVFLIFGAIFLSVVVIWSLVIAITRNGKVEVTVESAPRTAQIKIDGVGSGRGAHYITPGTHTFSAERDGYTKAERTVAVSKDLNYIALLPTPVTQAAKDEMNKAEESSWSETISGSAASSEGYAFQKKNPIVEKLPYSDIAGPFKIDYGYNQDNEDVIYLLISFSTPSGRQKALKWLDKQGADLTKTEIIYDGFVNPLVKEEESHD